MMDDNRLELHLLIEHLEQSLQVGSQLMYTLDIARQIRDKDSASESDYAFALAAIKELLTHQLNFDKSKVHVSYAPLHYHLAKYSIDLTHACKAAGIPLNVRTKINKNQSININNLNRLATLFGCNIDDLIEFVSEEDLVERFLMGLRIKGAPNISALVMDAQYSNDTEQDDDSPLPRSMTLNFENEDKAFTTICEMFDLDDPRDDIFYQFDR